MIPMENLLYVILVLFATLLFTDRYMLYGIVLVTLAFLLISGRDLVLYRNLMLYVFISIGIVAIVDMALDATGYFSSLFSLLVMKKEIYRVIIYLIIMNLMNIITVDIKTYSRVWRLLLIFIVAIAIVQYTKTIDIDSILKSIYGDSVQFYSSAKTEISEFRCGSVFINPNVFACFLVAMLGSYIFILQYVKESLLIKITTLGLIITGFVLAGSRTGLLLGVTVLIATVFISNTERNDWVLDRILRVVICVSVLWFVLVYVFNFKFFDYSSLRVFKVEEGMSNSLSEKIDIFTNLISNMNVLNIVFGYGPFDYTANKGVLLVDFDFGYFVCYFGLCGLMIYFTLLWAIFVWGDRELYGRRFLNIIYLIITIMFGLTAGVYFNLRIFSIYMFLFMPMIRAENEVVA